MGGPEPFRSRRAEIAVSTSGLDRKLLPPIERQCSRRSLLSSVALLELAGSADRAARPVEAARLRRSREPEHRRENLLLRIRVADDHVLPVHRLRRAAEA